MDFLPGLLIGLFPLALGGILWASLGTTREIFRRGNDADPLRREIEEENRARDAA